MLGSSHSYVAAAVAAAANKIIIIIIMEICKAPTLRLKALNKHNITHIMYIEMEMLSVTKMYRKEKKS